MRAQIYGFMGQNNEKRSTAILVINELAVYIFSNEYID